MFGMAKTLIVVYKDEMVVNQLKKMVETKDDNDEEEIVGTRDDSINIVAWDEKVWLENKKAGNISDKVLFLGNVKGTDKLVPVIDIKFDEYGIKYGWAGNQAVLFTDTKYLENRNEYLAFIEKLSELPVPDIIKEAVNTSIKESNTSVTTDITSQNDKKRDFLDKAKNSVFKAADVVSKEGIKMASKAEDLLRDKNKVTRQMLFYGVVYLYNDGLEEFMNA